MQRFWKWSARFSAAETTERTHTTRQKKPGTRVPYHRFAVDQLYGFAGSAGPSQSSVVVAGTVMPGVPEGVVEGERVSAQAPESLFVESESRISSSRSFPLSVPDEYVDIF